MEHFEEVDSNADAAAAVAESPSASIRQGAQALVNSRQAAYITQASQASPMSSQSPTPRKGNVRSQRPNTRNCPQYFTGKWLELYKKCYGCDESITQVPDPPSDYPLGNFNLNFPAFAPAYDRLYNPNNPVFWPITLQILTRSDVCLLYTWQPLSAENTYMAWNLRKPLASAKRHIKWWH